MCIDQQIIEVQPVDHIAESVVQQPNVITFTQDASDLTCLDTRRDQEDLPFDLTTDMTRYILGSLFNGALSPEIIVQGMVYLRLIKVEKNMDARRGNIGIHHPTAKAVHGKKSGDIRGRI